MKLGTRAGARSPEELQGFLWAPVAAGGPSSGVDAAVTSHQLGQAWRFCGISFSSHWNSVGHLQERCHFFAGRDPASGPPPG